MKLAAFLKHPKLRRLILPASSGPSYEPDEMRVWNYVILDTGDRRLASSPQMKWKDANRTNRVEVKVRCLFCNVKERTLISYRTLCSMLPCYGRPGNLKWQVYSLSTSLLDHLQVNRRLRSQALSFQMRSEFMASLKNVRTKLSPIIKSEVGHGEGTTN